nr:MAK10-like protein [Tanacetum cinerariifolium]
MGDENPIHTLRDYSKSSHEGHRNTIVLPEGNNVVPLRSDTICLVQNKCSFHRLRSEDPNQHLKDFLKLVDSLDINVENRERMRLRESHSETWTRFKDLLQKVPHHGIDRWLLIQFFYDHVSFPLKYEIDRAGGGKHHDKNADKSWEIIENIALYDHEGWNDLKDSIKTGQGNHLNEPPRQSSFTFRDRVRPNPQPKKLGTNFNARVRDYKETHTERIERFENDIFKQREEINNRMTEMLGLLKELTTSRTLKKVLIREEARHPITKNINSISLIRMKEKNVENNRPIDKSVVETNKSDEEEPPKGVDVKNKVERNADDEPAKSAREDAIKNEEEEPVGVSSSHTVGYNLNHRINEKLIEGLS